MSNRIASIGRLLAVICCWASSSWSAIPQIERDALIALYDSTNGAGWTDRTNWRNGDNSDFNDPGTECTWFGVTCDPANTAVIGLSMKKDIYRGNNLRGPIPTEIANLSHLTVLELGYNLLTGSIPVEIAGLREIVRLDLNENLLTGVIPPELGGLSELEDLWLRANRLTGNIPVELADIASLKGISIGENLLTGNIPPEFGRLSNLEGLGVSNNQLKGSIPSGIFGLTKLEVLWLHGNELTGAIPIDITNLRNLIDEFSDFGYNALHSDNPEVVEFLNQKQYGGDWQNTQTVAPDDVTIVSVTDTTIELSWIPIIYTDDSGGYEMLYSESRGGPYTLASRTADKIAAGGTITGLKPGTDYYLVVRTVTLGHSRNRNDVISDPSAEVHVTTTIESGCGYILSPSSGAFDNQGGSSSFRVNTADACSWTAATESEWIAISGSTSGSGNRTLFFRVESNDGPRRTGTIVVETSTFTVTQEAPYRDSDFVVSNNNPEVGEVVTFTADPALEVASWDFGGVNTDGNPPSVECAFLAAGACNEMQWAYGFAGEKFVTMELVDGRTATKTLVVDEASPNALVIPAAVSQAGALGTQWESDFRFFNPHASSLKVILEFEPENTENSSEELISRTFEIGPDQTVVFASLMEAFPNLGGDNMSGAVRVSCDDEENCSAIVVSRTFNDTTAGTLGLFVPALPAMTVGDEKLHLTGLFQNWNYRTNLRLVNFGDVTGWVEIGLVDAAGASVGANRSAKVPSRSTRQINDIATWLGVESGLGPFSIIVDTGGAPINGFATVIDNTSGDSVLFCSSFSNSSTLWLVGAAHLQGVNASRWRTDVWAYNPNDSILGCNATYFGGDSPDLGYDVGLTDIVPQAISQSLDVAGEVLGGEETRGYLVYKGDGEGPAPQIAARTYNLDADGGTSGLNLSTFAENDLLVPGDTGVFVGISNSQDQFVGFRTNLGLLNTDLERWTSVRITLVNLDGTEAAPAFELSIRPGVLLQFDVFKKLDLKDVSMTGTIKVDVLSGGGVAAYATEIDNVSQDSIYIPAQLVLKGSRK